MKLLVTHCQDIYVKALNARFGFESVFFVFEIPSFGGRCALLLWVEHAFIFILNIHL
jgi:hypothetical protein